MTRTPRTGLATFERCGGLLPAPMRSRPVVASSTWSLTSWFRVRFRLHSRVTLPSVSTGHAPDRQTSSALMIAVSLKIVAIACGR
jgi:hypothetical protein